MIIILELNYHNFSSKSMEHIEHEAIDKSMQILSILPSFDPHLGSQNEHTNQGTEPGPPHEALFLVLAYLPVFELLAMSEACMSLRDAVNKDVLPWLDIIVERPLNSWLSDEILMKITSKANGRLRTLALINCVKITDDGLQRVVEKNPFISKVWLSCFAKLISMYCLVFLFLALIVS